MGEGRRAEMRDPMMIEVPVGDDADDDVCHYRFEGKGRLILDTIHGTVIIDIRPNDVNAFTTVGRREDHLLLRGRAL
jgi:hypothetical protein